MNKRALAERLMSLALVLLLAVPLSFMLQSALFIELPVSWVLLFAVGTVVFLELISRSWKTAVGIPVALVFVGLFVWFRLSDDAQEAVRSFFTWAYQYISVALDHPHSWSVGLMAIVTVLVTFYLWLVGHRFFFFPAIAVFTVLFALFEWLIGHFDTLVPSMISCAVVLIFWVKSVQRRHARTSGRPMRENALPLLLAPLVAVALLGSMLWVQPDTAKDWQSRKVYDALERVNNYVADYTGFTRPRSAFSLSSSGFMPLGGRLGGPVALSDAEVLDVKTEVPLLLRGTIYNTYDGHRWTDTLTSQRYRVNAANTPAMEDIFDDNRPKVPAELAAEYSQYLRSFKLNIKPLTDGPSTLFVPYRGVKSITSDRLLALLPYFNSEGEAFSSADIRSSYSYTMDVDYLNYRAEGFDDLMKKLEALNPDDMLPADELSAYLALPDTIDPLVYQLAYYTATNPDLVATPNNLAYNLTHSNLDGSVLESSGFSSYEMARNLQQFLQRMYGYTLTPPIPPADSDFVSDFLLYEGQGYCTYFATAMTVLARMVGIPARYVEGYMVQEGSRNDDGSRTVRAQDAHAWAELYFAGVGWIPFDATPFGAAGQAGEGGGSTGQNLLPGPTMTPTPSFNPSDDLAPGTVRKGLTFEDVRRIIGITVLALVVLALGWILLMALLRRRSGSLAYVRRKYRSTRAQYAYYYFALLKLLAFYNYPVKRGETLYAFAGRIDRWLRLGTSSFRRIAEGMSRVSYSDYQPSEEDVGLIAAFYHELAHYTYHTVGWWFYLRFAVLGFKYQSKPTS